MKTSTILSLLTAARRVDDFTYLNLDYDERARRMNALASARNAVEVELVRDIPDITLEQS